MGFLAVAPYRDRRRSLCCSAPRRATAEYLALRRVCAEKRVNVQLELA